MSPRNLHHTKAHASHEMAALPPEPASASQPHRFSVGWPAPPNRSPQPAFSRLLNWLQPSLVALLDFSRFALPSRFARPSAPQAVVRLSATHSHLSLSSAFFASTSRGRTSFPLVQA